jgi:sulfide dehydrogenase cytochrome subunit
LRFAGGLLAAGAAFAQTTTPPAGRLLASNCFQCHGTDGGGGFERLAGMSANEIVGELREMRLKSAPDIMEVHARGYSDAQLRLIGNYFASLRGGTTSTATQNTSNEEKDDD